MKFTNKIVILVSIQIAFIIGSFFIIAHLESQNSLAGNVVNVVGKNRHLADLVQIEIHREWFHGEHKGRVSNALDELENNILFLKHGGKRDGIQIMPLASHYDDEWDKMHAKFKEYKTIVIGLAGNRDPAYSEIKRMEMMGRELVDLFDGLTKKLGEDIDKSSGWLVEIQIILGMINVGVHLFMFWIIWAIFKEYVRNLPRTKKFSIIGEFASIMAHDMKNPLGTLLNSVSIIRHHAKEEQVKTELARMDRSIMRMSHQIDGVLNYVRDTPLYRKPASLRNILDRSVDSMNMPDNIKVILPQNDATVLCDSQKMEFVFSNLLLNSIQAIEDRTGQITVRIIDRPEIVIEFEDSAGALSRKDMHRIFEPLFTKKTQGTGLGLTSCRKIINKHGGSITVSIDPTTFTVRLPRN